MNTVNPLWLKIKPCIPVVGNTLAVLGLYFIGIKLFEHVESESLSHLITPLFIVQLSIWILLYTSLLFILGVNWKWLLSAEGETFETKAIVNLYGKSQIAKYIPGNIFHIAGRQVLGYQMGISQSAMFKTTLWEITLLALAGLISGGIMYLKVSPIYALMLIFLMLSLFVLGRKLARNTRIKVWVLGGYICFHLASALLFCGVVYTQDASVFPDQLTIICSAYILSWLVGFVTPGAPGGVGVRELVVYTLLSATVSSSVLLLAIIISRIMTTCGDCAFFLISSLSSAANREKSVPINTL